MKSNKHPRSNSPIGRKPAKPNRKRRSAGPCPGKRSRGCPKDTLLEKRDAIIAARVSRGRETYREIGADYGLSRERVRQIAKAMIPQTGTRRVRQGSEKYGWCPRCRTALKKQEADGSRRPCSVDVRNELCGKCRREIYCRPVVLNCRCGRTKTLKYGLIRRQQQQGVRLGFKRTDANGRTGTYLCRQCFYDSMWMHGPGKGAKDRAGKRSQAVRRRPCQRRESRGTP
ncbi:MAG: sigma factor-like helix-turn-helix DNA-binding protein [Candidatus Edwardsbacteria bacterium]|nr:sigma factor-like helix-turn-helix DNA-binding protein [Candidatus Edwardsbacteria bacterium]